MSGRADKSDETAELIMSIASIGGQHPSHPDLTRVDPLRHYHTAEGCLSQADLDSEEDSCTRREVVLRYLLLSAVLDQGPDIQGVRVLLSEVTNDLYSSGIRFLHDPIAFFDDLGVALEQILARHESVKALRADDWAEVNRSRASRYNLFMDNTKQALCYAVFRWGAPLAVPLILERDIAGGRYDGRRQSALADYVESWPSAEVMSRQIKSHERYGLGKAIGDKACHLFAKWMVSSYSLVRQMRPGWDHLSYELPFDSNAGRVFWRTGYLLRWATMDDYIRYGVVQRHRGKGGTDYLRVTNLRQKAVTRPVPDYVRNNYTKVVAAHLRTRQKPRNLYINEIHHAYLYAMRDQVERGVADLDDGLVHIGTTYCYNHEKPRCDQCPIQDLCVGKQERPELILAFRT